MGDLSRMAFAGRDTRPALGLSELASLAQRAKALSDSLWSVNSRAEAVEWCSDADAILKEIVRMGAAA